MGIFHCNNCGAQATSWIGKCPECSQWNTYQEETNIVDKPGVSKSKKYKHQQGKVGAVSINNVVVEKDSRASTSIGEFDRVLGGGVLKGSVILVAGEPGIGKSTLMLQLAGNLSKKGTVLYISGEESTQQIKYRAERLQINSKQLLLLPVTDMTEIQEQIMTISPDFIIIDSIQTITRDDVSSGAGSVSQVKECSTAFVEIAKSKNIPVFLIGQVTKDGSVAGPRILEHMVDTVLYFEGEKSRQFRILRAIKNRFGSTNEVGIFEMSNDGLKEVVNPSEMLIDEGSLGSAGSCVAVAMEGTRPMLVEIQALVSYSKLPSPRRVVSGLDYNRVSVIIGILEKKAGIKLSDYDIFVNVVSGMYIEETSSDLPVALAIASSAKNIGLDPKSVVIGEIGLTGEIRSITNISQRILEAQKLGFNKMLFPKGNEKQLIGLKGIIPVALSNINEAINSCFSRP